MHIFAVKVLVTLFLRFAAMECRVFLSGIPFLMNEAWLRNVLQSQDIKQPWKVCILRKGEHTKDWQWANAFLWFADKAEAQAVAQALDGYQLSGWWKRFEAQLARTDPQWTRNWHQCFGCKPSNSKNWISNIFYYWHELLQKNVVGICGLNFYLDSILNQGQQAEALPGTGRNLGDSNGKLQWQQVSSPLYILGMCVSLCL